MAIKPKHIMSYVNTIQNLVGFPVSSFSVFINRKTVFALFNCTEVLCFFTGTFYMHSTAVFYFFTL